MTEQSFADPVVFGPPAAPPPEPAPAPARRPPPRRKGPIELAVARDLRTMPDALRLSAIAASALNLAREIDNLEMTARDTAGHTRELRMCMTQLADLAPGERKGDSTDMLRERRERRMTTAE